MAVVDDVLYACVLINDANIIRVLYYIYIFILFIYYYYLFLLYLYYIIIYNETMSI